ncbi:MAG: Polyketide synthase PksR [Luteibacter sp.]|uniref:class I SAM-dependent methyltransferase n=1 Tax=Luteibacter sp. TaxID=1886636 RepID=UPI00138467ED|nr:class I SAM-dependent methyltransferase [Luteibacter sp.]KAF1007472.1 MAG: Polyketide synthase PksR [Luteibacter sp.]
MTIDATRAHESGLAALARALPGGLNALPACEPALERLEHRSLSAQIELLRRHRAIDDTWRDTVSIAGTIHVAPRHRWLLARWLVALEASGAIERQGDTWRDRPDHVFTVEGDLAADYAALGFPERLARLHQAMLDRLDALLRDEVSMSSLLFPDGRIIESLAAYQSNPFTAYVNAACGEGLRQCPAQGPRLRLLELGGGPGLTTAAVLDALQGRPVDYLFTDVSRLFIQAMGLPGVRHAVLDIDRDFDAQGAPTGSFDVVVAGNVLHNARDVDRTLRSIHAALVPGGWLVFSEAVADNRILLTSMQFLLSPGPGQTMAGSGDARAATGEIFLDEAGWSQRLAAAGFTSLATLPDHAAGTLRRGGQYLFLAQAAENHP